MFVGNDLRRDDVRRRIILLVLNHSSIGVPGYVHIIVFSY
jgi:hypothetical protein